MIYTLVCFNGAEIPIDVKDRFNLEQLQGLVGGLIEFAYVGKKVLCINEEGLLINLPMNRKYPNLAGNVIEGRDSSSSDFIGI